MVEYQNYIEGKAQGNVLKASLNEDEDYEEETALVAREAAGLNFTETTAGATGRDSTLDTTRSTSIDIKMPDAICQIEGCT